MSPWRVEIRDLRGQIVSRSFTRKSDAEEFERNEKRKRQLMKAGLDAPQDEILFLDYAKTWLSRRSTGKQSSFRQDESRLKNYWIEPFGAYPLQTMTTAMIKERLDQIQFEMKHAPGDRNRHRALLHKFFQDAYLEDKVVHNPVSKIPLVDESKKTRTSGTLQSDRDQAAYVKALYSEGPRFGMLGSLMLWTGARISSASAMQYRDIDFEVGIVHIRRLIEKITRTIHDRTKGDGDEGEEIVPLFPVLRDRILSHRKMTTFTRPTDFIACQPDGSPMFYEVFLTAHERAVKAAGLARFTPHALRKAFATNAKRAGYTRSEIREMLGHSSDAVTDRYDLKDMEHLVEKGRRLGFGNSVAQVSPNTISDHRIKRVDK